MISDVFEIARSGASVEGVLPVSEMQRLDTPSREGLFRWKAVGFSDRENALFIDLEVDGELVQICQRCLENVGETLSFRRRFFLARSEREADAAALDDDEVEVVVGSEHFDFAELVEDEIILSLPLAPKHRSCPQPLGIDDSGTDSHELSEDSNAPAEGANGISPFASLAGLKMRGTAGRHE